MEPLMGAMKENIAVRDDDWTGKTERMTCQEAWVVTIQENGHPQVVHDSLKLVQGLELAEKGF